MNEEVDIMVSVCMITYNHGAYIEKAIKSVLDQQTKFKIELVIGEDCSKDNTREVCEKLAGQYPGIIKLLPTDKNYGAMQNFLRTYEACSGKYMALLEGDDYWTDPYKLQKQVNFMEENNNYSMCFSKVEILKERKSDITYYQPLNKSTLEFKDVVFAHYIPTLTMLFRNTLKLPQWIDKVKACDRALAMLLTANGPAKYFDESMGVYRVHEGGITNTAKQNEDINYDAYYIFKHLLPHTGLSQKFILWYIIIKNRTADYFRKTGLMRK